MAITVIEDNKPIVTFLTGIFVANKLTPAWLSDPDDCFQ